MNQHQILMGKHRTPIVLVKDNSQIAIASSSNEFGAIAHFDTHKVNANKCEKALDAERSLGNIGSHVYNFANSEATQTTVFGGNIPSGEFFLRTYSPKAQKLVAEIAKEYNLILTGDSQKNRKTDYILHVTGSTTLNPLKITEMIQANYSAGDVQYFEPDLLAKPVFFNTPTTEPLMSMQWHLGHEQKHDGLAQYGIGAVNDQNKAEPRWFVKGAHAYVKAAWEKYGLGSRDVFGCIVDDGFDLVHPEIQDANVTLQWDLAKGIATAAMDKTDFHGTSVFGVTGAPLNGSGIVGASPKNEFALINLKYLSNSTFRNLRDIVVANNIAYMNWSWGHPSLSHVMPVEVEEAITDMATKGRGGKGCVITVAAGNHGQNAVVNEKRDENGNIQLIGSYATHPDVMAIAASNSHDERVSYSAIGKHLSVAAPSSGTHIVRETNKGKTGMPITTADVLGESGYNKGDKKLTIAKEGFDADFTNTFGGTSSAAPLVAGVCGLVLSVNPDLTAKQVKEIIEDTADKVGKYSDYLGESQHSIYMGNGRANALKACERAAELLPKEEEENEVGEGQDFEIVDSLTLKPVLDFQIALKPNQGIVLEAEQEGAYVLNILNKAVTAFSSTELTLPSVGKIEVYQQQSKTPTISDFKLKLGIEAISYQHQFSDLEKANYSYLVVNRDSKELFVSFQVLKL